MTPFFIKEDKKTFHIVQKQKLKLEKLVSCSHYILLSAKGMISMVMFYTYPWNGIAVVPTEALEG